MMYNEEWKNSQIQNRLKKSLPSEELPDFEFQSLDFERQGYGGYDDYEEEYENPEYSPATNFVFDGVNASNLDDTSKVRLKSFEFIEWGINRKATEREVDNVNSNHREQVLEVYRFYARHDPHVYLNSIGVKSKAQKLEYIVEEESVDLELVINRMTELEFLYEPGTEAYNKKLERISEETWCSAYFLKNLLALVREVEEEIIENRNATHTGNSIARGAFGITKAMVSKPSPKIVHGGGGGTDPQLAHHLITKGLRLRI